MRTRKKPHEDVAVEFTALRPGEKLFEELLTDSESDGATTHDKIFVARRAALDVSALRQALLDLDKAVMAGDGRLIRSLLRDYIEGCSCGEAQRVA